MAQPIREISNGAVLTLRTRRPQSIIWLRGARLEPSNHGRAVPTSTVGGPHEATEFSAWLASEENGHMTGRTICIDGGADVVICGEAFGDC